MQSIGDFAPDQVHNPLTLEHILRRSLALTSRFKPLVTLNDGQPV